MTWLQRYRLRHYIRNSIWVFPALAMVLALILVRLLHWLEVSMAWQSDFNPDTMRAVLGNLAGAMFTFIVFVCSSLLLVVQLASAQLTPRMIGVLLRDPVTKLTLSMFVFTFAFAISALTRIGATVPALTAEIAGYSSAASLAVFLFLIDRVGKLLRPSGALRSVASQAHHVIRSVYPRRLSEGTAAPTSLIETRKEPGRAIKSRKAGVVLAFDVRGLVALAARSDCVIELAPQVGDFVAPGDPLFRIYGGVELPESLLYHSIALGPERTMEQDPALAFRVAVDIASKALSPAINDPTTAVLALDQLHHLLRNVGLRRLDDERVLDRTGRVRLIYRTPNWEDFVALAATEIRHYGGASIQISRRMRAMLENLIRTLPEQRAEPLRHELKMLSLSAKSSFSEPEDRALTEIGDSQGLGGNRESNPTMTQERSHHRTTERSLP